MHNIYRVNCFGKTCRHCSNSVFIKDSILGDRLYMCSVINKKHKEIDARDCNAFRCNEQGKYLYCEECNAGAPVKRLRRY